MVSSWQARLPGNSLSNPVITQLPLPSLGSHHLQERGSQGWVLKVSFQRCFSATLTSSHPPPAPALPQPSPPSSQSHTHTHTRALGSLSLRFGVDGTEGCTGGREGRREEGRGQEGCWGQGSCRLGTGPGREYGFFRVSAAFCPTLGLCFL